MTLTGNGLTSLVLRQKGTIGITLPQEDMPFTCEGTIPDIIVNPHAIPSRMTVAQLVECIAGKAATMDGKRKNATCFDHDSPEEIEAQLKAVGYESRGSETMYCGFTGKPLEAKIFIGPTYYQRLKHMVADKIHCLTLDHEVLTLSGWKYFHTLTYNDKVASITKDGYLIYDTPVKLLYFPNHEGNMYTIKNQNIDLCVTENHRMYVSKCYSRKHVWQPYELIDASDIMGKHVKYKKCAKNRNIDYQYILDNNCTLPMDEWLLFLGIWIAEGWVCTSKNNVVQICHIKQRVKDVLYKILPILGFEYTEHMNNGQLEKLSITHKMLYNCLKPLSRGAPKKYLPSWVWQLSEAQARKLIYGMVLGDGCFKNDKVHIYYTSSSKLADDFQRLCLHAGYSSNKTIHLYAGNETIIHGRKVKSNYDIYRLSIITIKNYPAVNHGHCNTQKIQKESMEFMKIPVFCLEMPHETLYVRRNGIPCWTGNSRAKGPIQILTRQPVEGRARDGGLRFGEMERDAIISHGASAFLKERLMDQSDAYEICVCQKCGYMAIEDAQRHVMVCSMCKSSEHTTEVTIPYACKLLFQELISMNIAPIMAFNE